MKAVFPYTYDPDHGEELRFAIRSMVKHFKPFSGVVVVGDCPIWYTGEHIQCNDIPGRKEFSIYSKLMQVRETVLFCNDDHFALQDFNETLPNYYDFPCKEKKPVDKTYKDLYAACPPHWLNFDVHCPMIIDTTVFEWIIDRPIKTYYGNQHKVQGTRYADCKLRGELSSGEIIQRIKGRPFFNTHGNSKLAGMPVILRQLYPEPSEYET